MARKKASVARPVSPGAASGSVPTSATLTTPPPSAPHRTATADAAKAQERFWLEAGVVYVARRLGSLQVAVFSLSIFAVVLIIGTVIESWYDGKVAQQLVYRTWWFSGLLGLLGVNIFFAAAKKWPWKKYQTGFLITHVGLLTMVAGGLLNSLGGTDAQMPVVDSDDPKYFSSRGPHTSSEMIDQEVSKIKVRQPHKDREKVAEYDFQPGPFVWRDDEYIQAHSDRLAGLLNFLAHPLPRNWEADLGGGARLEVLNSYPHCKEEQFGPARSADAPSFPAIQLQLASSRAGQIPDRWVAYHEGDEVLSLGPAMVEFLARDLPPDLLEEFREPPRPGQTGRRGQLVIYISGRRFSFDVAEGLKGDPQPLGDTGWRVKFFDFAKGKEQRDVIANPAAAFELQGPRNQELRLGIRARKPAELIQGHASADTANIRVWYHPPDYRYGNDNARGLLQFVTAKDGRIYYRSFNSSKGAFNFETSGTVEKGDRPQPIWEGMNWKFQISNYLPNAEAGPYFIPVNRRLGLEDGRTPPAIRCRLSVGKDSREFWLAKQFILNKSEASLKPLEVAGTAFEIGYTSFTRSLDFEIALLRAETTTDKGTGHPATYTSYVLLTDKAKNINGEPRVITMNQPLDHNGFKLYQSGLNPVEMDEDEKPVNQSVFTVSKDPGLWLKYAGSTMLALGIACMFYMKAYFFKPRGKSRPAANAPAGRVAAREN